MINIISRQAETFGVSGVRKVFVNLIKGLDLIGYPYVINRDINATKRLWIHDDQYALELMHKSKAYKIVGPNLYVLPRDIPPRVQFGGAIYVQPSDWASNLWEHLGFSSCPIVSWPVGVDTDQFSPSTDKKSSQKILIYHKLRDSEELKYILQTVETMGLSYRLIRYGNYTESDYLDALRQTSFMIWHGRHESQGLALQEALSCNIPILVCDVHSLSQSTDKYDWPEDSVGFKVSAAPYFDARCGIKISSMEQLKEGIESMRDRTASFGPRRYILENLSLERQAHKFVSLWDEWGIGETEGIVESLNNNDHLSLPFYVKVRRRAGGLTRRIQKMIR